MSNKIFKNLTQLNFFYSDGQEIYFSCLEPAFDWFEKKFSIKEIYPPTKTSILKSDISPSTITKKDLLYMSENNFPHVMRKYLCVVSLDCNQKITYDLYEDTASVIYLKPSNNSYIGFDYSVVENFFYSKIIKTSQDLLNDVDIIVVKDRNMEIFDKAYKECLENNPSFFLKMQ